MKSIHEMTEQEILALEDKEVNRIIKYTCAEQGVKFESEPEKPEYEPDIAPDITFYRVGSIYLKDKGEAEKLSEFLSKMKSLTNYGYESHYLHYEAEVDLQDAKEVKKDYMYSKGLIKEALRVKEANKEKEAAYKEAYQAWEEERENYNRVSSEIWEKVHEVRNKHNKLEEHLERFKSEYLPLVNNEYALAMPFYKKAYDLSEEAENYIKSNLQCQSKD